MRLFFIHESDEDHGNTWFCSRHVTPCDNVAVRLLSSTVNRSTGSVIVREMLRELLKRERKSATPGLRRLAERSGVIE